MPIVMAILMAMSVNVGMVKATDNSLINNPSFEEEINKEDIQLYKANRTNEKAYDGKYSIKIGAEKPENEADVPMWQYNQGKGGMNIVVRNAQPNTEYTVKLHTWNETGVRFESGVIDIDGSSDTLWNIGMDSTKDALKSTEWKEVTHTITTGPRTNEFYIFAYCMNQKDGRDSGAFYVDGIELTKGATKESNTTSIEYNVSDTHDFPNTIPAIQSFEKADESYFKLNPSYQIISTDNFSKAKAEYLGDSLVDKGIIKHYELKVIDNIEDGEGIVVVKQPINFTLPEADVIYSEVDSYQIDITEDKAIIHSDYIEGIQNGTMTLLQALVQRSQLPTGTVKDYTDQRMRGFQIDTARTFFSVDWLKEQMEQMAYYKQNKLQIRLKDSEGIRWQSQIVPELMDEDGYIYTKEDAKELVEYAKKFNIEIIPEVDYPGHSEMEVDMIENAGSSGLLTGSRNNGRVPVLDITNKKIREYIIEVTKEAAEYFEADTIHIGGDEYFDITSGTDRDLETWANDVLGTTNSTRKDAMILYFNEVAGAMLDAGYNVLLWNDNVALGGNVELDKRITIDFWAGGFGGRSLRGSEGANAGYNILSSSSTNYHNLWYQEVKESVRNPFPKEMYEKFTRFNYSVSSSRYEQDEKLSQNKDKSLGQMFPIWSDILGGVSGHVLERTLFPRYATFSYLVWGAQCNEKPLTYGQLERLIFDLGAPIQNIKTNSLINYNQADLQIVINEIEKTLNTMKTEDENIQANIDALNKKINDVKENMESYEVNSFYTEVIDEIIYDFENIEFVTTIEENENDVTILQEALESIKTINTDLYTKETVSVLNDVIKEIQRMITNPRATIEKMNAIVETLNTAKENLEYKVADYSKVDLAIAKANILNKEDYLDFSKVTNAIEAVIRDKNITEQTIVDGYAKAIHNAIADLTPAFEPGDKTALQDLLNQARTIKAQYCIKESYEELEAVMNEAKAILNKHVVKQEDVDAAITKLQTAIDNVKYKPADYSRLERALKDLEWRLPEDFNDYSVIEEILDLIDYNLDSRQQSEIDKLADKLFDAIDDEYENWDKYYLKSALEEAEETLENKKDLYTQKSLQNLYDTMKSAEELLKMVGADPDELWNNENAIYDAIDALEKKADYSELEMMVAKVEGLNQDDYTNFEIVAEIIDAIDWDYSKDEQDKVNALVRAIEDAINSLEVKPVNKDSLNIAIEEALKITDEKLANVVPVVVNEFKAALAHAQEISLSSSASQQDVYDAFDRLANAMHMLSFIKGDKTDLEGLVIKITQLNANDYLTNTWDAMVPVLEEAKNVVANENALEYEVQESYEKLLRAFLELRLKPNKDLLNELINQAETLNSAKYQSETWQPFVLALANAKDTAANESATTAEIEAAYNSLHKAINNLIEVTPVDQNTAVSVPSADKENSLKTGDEINLGFFTVIGTIAMLSVIGLSKKRKIN